MSDVFRSRQVLKSGQLNRALRDVGAAAAETAAAPFATAAAASATAAADSASDAATSAAAASAAVTAALGPILLTGVAGTSTAYTATASHAPAAGRCYLWTPHVDSGAPTITLSINAGTARSIRQSDGSQPVAGQFRAGRTYFCHFSALNTFIVLGEADELFVWTAMHLRRSAGFNIGFRQPSDTADRAQVQFINDGRVILRAGGDGSTLGAQVLEVQTDGDVRPLVGQFIDRRSQPVYSLHNPPGVEDDMRELAAATAWGPWWEGPHEAVAISSTRPYSVSGGDLGRHLRVTASGAWLDFQTMPLNTSIIVDVQSGASAVLYSGYTGATWRNTGGTRLAAAAGSIVHVIKGQTDITAFALAGSVTADTTTVPTYSRKWAFGPGQSWAERETKNAARGIQRVLTANSLNSDVLLVQDVAAGASALIIGAPTDPSNYWWDSSTGLPGPNATAMRDAVLAAPASPSLTDCVVMYGLNDLSIFDATGSSTPTIWTQAQLDLQAWLRTELSLPNLRFWICPLPSQDLGTFSETKWYAMRRAQLDVVGLDADTHRGPDYYDLPRPYGDRHHAYAHQAEHGARVAKFITNLTDSKSNYVGPKIVSFARTAANTYVVTIDRQGGLAMQRPVVPVGFAIMPGGDLFATPLTVRAGGYTWGTSGSNDTLTIETTTDDASADLAFPYGSAWELSHPSRLIRALDPATAEWMPLQTYHPTA